MVVSCDKLALKQNQAEWWILEEHKLRLAVNHWEPLECAKLNTKLLQAASATNWATFSSNTDAPGHMNQKQNSNTDQKARPIVCSSVGMAWPFD